MKQTESLNVGTGKKPKIVLLMSFVITLSFGGTVIADDKQRIENLENEITVLKESQKKLEKQLASLRDQINKGNGRSSPIRDLENVLVDTEADPVLGEEDAKLVMIEFSDYQCPYCKRHATTVWPEIKKQYVDTGKMKLIFHDFPLTRIHKEAALAAQAATCAGDQGKYWEMHDRLFEHPKAIKPVANHAEALHLEMDAFNDCISSEKYAQEVKDDTDQALELGVRSTPTFIFAVTNDKGEIIGKRLVRGALPFEKFKEEIDKLLAEQS